MHYWLINDWFFLKEQVDWNYCYDRVNRIMRFIKFRRLVFQEVSNAWNTLLQGLKHFVPRLETLCFITWNTLFQGMKHFVPTVGTGLGTTCYDFTLYFDFVSSDYDWDWSLGSDGNNCHHVAVTSCRHIAICWLLVWYRGFVTGDGKMWVI